MLRKNKLNKLVWLPLNKNYYENRTKASHRRFTRKKYVFTQHGFLDVTYEIKLFDPIRFGFYAILCKS